MSAAAVLITGDTNVRGSLRFVQLPDGRRGFHIHALGDTTNGCNSTGDLGNIIATLDGVAEISIVVNQIPLTGQHSILGRAVVVYADPDDLGKANFSLMNHLTDGHELCKTAGNAGAGIGCGIIELQSSV